MRAVQWNWWFALGGLALLAACGGQPGELTLVEVDGQPILASELRAFEATLAEHLRADQRGVDAHRLHLQNLVDRQLMSIEAHKRNISRLPGLEKVLTEQVNQQLVNRVIADQVEARIRIAEEELQAAYEEYGLGWQVWPAHILSATEEDALEVIRLLEEGADFSALARERSLADDAERGGNLGGYFDQGGAIGPLREATFHLEVGEISRPIRTVDGYEVVKIIDKRRSPYAQMRGQIVIQMRERKHRQGRAALVNELKERWDFRYHREWTWTVVEALRGGKLTTVQRETPFVSFAGEHLTIEDCVRAIKEQNPRVAPTDSLRLLAYLEASIIPSTLIAFTARAEGMHETSEMQAWKDKKREELIVSQLYIDEVASSVQTVSDEEIEQHYLERLEGYRSLPGPIELTEVLVDTREEAEAILEAARHGERLEALAVRHSVRPQMAPLGGHAVADSGKMHIDKLISSPYRNFFGVAEDNYRDVGKLQGPLSVEGKYSVFRLDAPALLEPLPLSQVYRPIRKRLREQREAVRFEVFIDSLRQVYADRVNWHEDRLRQYAATW